MGLDVTPVYRKLTDASDFPRPRKPKTCLRFFRWRLLPTSSADSSTAKCSGWRET